MPRYTTVITSTWSLERAYAFMSDFSNAERWDPGVSTARRLDDGPIQPGSAFELIVLFGGRKMPLRYEVRSMRVPEEVVFVASTNRLDSVDTLSFERVGDGCRMTYSADLRLKGLAALATPLLAMGFRRVGDRARDSLRTVLTSNG